MSIDSVKYSREVYLADEQHRVVYSDSKQPIAFVHRNYGDPTLAIGRGIKI